MRRIYTLLVLMLLISARVFSQSANPNDPNDFQYMFIDAGDNHTVALRCNGTVACWGDNAFGQLGNDNSPTDSNIPVTVRITPGTDTLRNIIAVAAGANHTLALRADGTVWSWGQNTNGQLGDNSVTQRNFAVQVRAVGVAGFLTDVVAIAAGTSHSLAILNDGSALAWGLNSKGQLADGSTTQRNRPVYMTGIDVGNTAYAVAGGECHTYLLQSNGRVKSCGCDEDGQLGNDGNSGMTETTSLIYVNTNQTGTIPLENIIAIASGPKNALALDSTGALWSWGITGSPNYSLGRTSSTPASKYAGQVSTITNAVAIAAGTYTGFALLTDSTVMAFGTDNLGQLGLGAGDNSTIDPTLIPSLSGVIAIAAGGPHTVLMLDNDSIYTFGDNSQGQLGIGSTGGNRQSPVKVSQYMLGIIQADAGPDKFMCVGDSVQIGNEVPDYNQFTYTWQPSTYLTGGSIVTNRPDTLASPFANFPIPNTINYILTKEYRVGGNEICVISDTVKVSATDRAEAEFISSAPACMGDVVNFLSTGNAGPYTKYQWDFGAGAIVPSGMDTVYNPTGITYAFHGLKLVTLVVTDSCGGLVTTDTYSDGVLIREIPMASFSSNAPICAFEMVNFTNTGSAGGGWTYSWDFGADAIPTGSTAQNPYGVFYTTSGIKTVTFTISNGYCFDTYTENITVNETPIADFVSTAPQCTGLGVNFTNTGSTGGTWTYSWDFDSGATPATSTAQNPNNIIYNTSGNKTVRFIITNGTCSDTIFKTITIHQTPAVGFNFTNNVCGGTDVNFTNTGATGGGWSYSWDLGSGATPATSNAENPTGILYATHGNKTITQTISSGYCSNSLTQTLTILQRPVADFESTAPQCTGLGVNFTNTGTTTGTWNYSWNFGSGATPATSTTQNPSGVVYSTAGNKTVRFIITNGTCSDTIFKTITIHQTPAVGFTFVNNVCGGTEVSFTNTGATGGSWAHSWDLGAGAVPATSNAENPSGIMYDFHGNKTITQTISSGYCSNSLTQTLTILQRPVADFESTAPQCTGLGVNFTNTGTTTGTWNYSWNFGSGATPATSTAQNPSGVVYSTAGNKTVRFIITNGTCSDTIFKTITIHQTPAVGFTFVNNVCGGTEVSFTNTGATGGSWSYSWDLGSGAVPATSNAENPTGILYATHGNKTVTQTISSGYCSNSLTQTLTILQRPVADFESTAPQCTGLGVNFTNTGTTTGTWNYSWNFGSGATPATSTTQSPSGVVYSTAGNKTVRFIITNGTCSDTIFKTITIHQTPAVGFTFINNVCGGTEVNFTNTGATGGSWSYSWDLGAGAVPATSNAENPTGIMYDFHGNKTITQTISSGYCSNSYTQLLTILERPVADFENTAPQCTGLGVDFIYTGTTTGLWNYAWDFGTDATPTTSMSQNPNGVVYSSAGNKTIRFIIYNASCSDTIFKTITIHQTPAVSFTSNAPQCAGTGFDFTNTGATGSNWTFTWDFGQDAIPATSVNEHPVGVLYSSGGIKTITFIIADQNCNATVTDVITVNHTPVANFSSTAPQCTQLDVDFTNTGSTGGLWTYAWDFGSGATPATSTDENPSGIVYSTPGVKLVKLLVTDGVCTDSIIQSIIIHLTPTADFTSNAPQCVGNGVNFTNIGTSGFNWTYTWDLGQDALPATSVNENPVGVIYSTGGQKIITFTIADQNCVSTITKNIIINSLPVADAGEDTTICANRTVQIGSITVAGYSYYWFPASTLDNPYIANPIAAPIANITEYIVTVVNDTTQCVNRDTIIVTMLNPLIANAGIDVAICEFDSIQIGAGLIEGQYYAWMPTEGLSDATASNPMASPSQTTTYILTVTDTAGCDAISDEVLITVYPLPDANAGIDDTIMYGASTQLIATGGVQYYWYPTEGLSNAYLFNPIASPDSTTDYIVVVTDIFGCVNRDTVNIVVYNYEKPYWLPNAFSPNNNGLNDIFYVRGGNYETFEFTIYNRYGEEIFKSRDVEKGWDGRNVFTGEKMPSGAYVYKIYVKLFNGEIFEDKGIVNLVR